MYNIGDKITLRVKSIFKKSNTISGIIVSKKYVEYDDWMSMTVEYNEYKINIGEKIITLKDDNLSFKYSIITEQ